MSPIIELQRRMVEAGRIRAGDQQPDSKGVPRPHKLSHWRLTSKDKQRLDEAATLWGGETRQWEDQWEVYTATSELPVMLLPGQMPTTWYELWSKGGCQRRCDGLHELLSDSSCLCDADERECKPHTRLSVLLPDLPGIGSWLLSSTGWNAAAELLGAADLLQRASAQGVLIPARLRLEQRTSVKAGQTRKFAVPVLDVDVAFRALLGGELTPPREQAALPAGYTPVQQEIGNGSSLAEGLATAETQTLTRTPRVTLPDDDVLDEEPGAEPSPTAAHPAGGAGGSGTEPAPSASDTDPESSVANDPPPAGDSGNTVSRSTRDKPITSAMSTKLGVLIGRVRDEAGVVTTGDLYRKLAEVRGVDLSALRASIPEDVRDAEGVLHIGPALKTLTRAEGHSLIDWLEELEESARAGAAA